MVQTKSVGAVVLAAGSSSRMGRPKQTLQFKGESLLRRAVQAAIGAGCDPVIVVTGAHADLSRRELEGLDVREVLNTSWETGMASSVRAGVEAIADADAVVLLLCDQPHVTSEVISDLIAAYRSTGKPIIASTYGETFGVPALFSHTLFHELTQLEGTSGAKEVIKRHRADVHFLPFQDGNVDIDTVDDFSRLLKRS